MALAMPRPTPLASGIYRLNIRVPADLAPKMRGAQVTLPFGASVVTVVVTDKVAFSLLTKEPALAKARFTPAYAALARHFDNLRAGPQALPHKQAVALAGEVYRRRVERYENDPALTPDAVEAAIRETNDAVAEWRYGNGGEDDDFELIPTRAERASWSMRID